jgi:hypothetical protein
VVDTFTDVKDSAEAPRDAHVPMQAGMRREHVAHVSDGASAATARS